MLTYEEARHFPPKNNEAYREATAAELIGTEHGISPRELYNAASKAGVSLAKGFGEYIRRKAVVVQLVEKGK